MARYLSPLVRSSSPVCGILVLLATLCAGLIPGHRQFAQADDAPQQAESADANRGSSGNRLTYLDAFCDPYYPSLQLAKLITPQWVGTEGVEAVVTLGIDDMRDPAPYEKYMRPILERLKQIDGRGPISIMTNQVDPAHPQLPKWLSEGVSLETHTADHPCPCLQGGDFAKAKSTYDRCVDQLAAVENSHPVCFRFPCMDSLNTPSPRAYVEILNSKTAQGNFCQMSSSTLCLLTPDDPALPRDLVLNSEGKSRFERYVPFDPFVNRVDNYPYPYIISQRLWEFPCGVPDDWQGQKLQAPKNPKTLKDLKAMLDAVVIKQGVANVVFHPYDWLSNEQYVDFVDHAVEKHGSKVLFLNFKECLDRLNKNLLAGQPIRAADGGDNGVRLLDVNNDGYLDVVIGNDKLKRTRLWQPETNSWKDIDFPVTLVEVTADGERRDAGVRFGALQASGNASFLVASEKQRGLWHFDGKAWVRETEFGSPAAIHDGPQLDSGPLFTVQGGRDMGVRLRDVDGDGICEILLAGSKQRATFVYDRENKSWRSSKAVLPEPLVDRTGSDAGLRFVDLNKDGHDDIVFSNERRFSVHVYHRRHGGWSRRARAGHRRDENAIPMIVRAGTNNGAWFAKDHMWIQNEDTNRLPAGVDRRSFAQLLGKDFPPPKSAEESLQSIRVRDGLKVELVAAEPLVKDPIAIDWGADGRLWVVEMADYPLGMDNQGKPGGRVRYLEDTNGDGKYDKSTLFLDGLPYPTGVMAYMGGVLVSAAPQIIYAEDTSRDGKANYTKVLYEGFGLGNQQHRMNGFCQGLDNWIYLADGGSGGEVISHKTGKKVNTRSRDIRIRPHDGAIEPLAGHSQFGRRRDDWGNWFGCDNVTPLRHFVLADRYLRRNPHAAPASTHINIVRTDNTQLFPISRVLSHFQGYRPPAPGEEHHFTSASATDFYRDNLLGDDLAGNTFTSAPVHNLVHRRVMSPRGLTFYSRRAADEQDREFLASTDSWFRPTMARTGPDGALYVVDMYRLVIEHPEWIDDAYEKELDLRAGHEQGRIYRVVPADKPLREVPRFDKLSSEELVARLESPNGIQRDMAQRLLVQQQHPRAVGPLKKLITKSETELAKVHAIYTLHGLGKLDDTTLTHAINLPSKVARHATRLGESRNRITTWRADLSPQLRLQVAYALGEHKSPFTGRDLGRMIIDQRDDAMFVAAATSSLTEKNLPYAIMEVLQHRNKDDNARRVFAQLTELAAAQKNREALNLIVRAIENEAIQAATNNKTAKSSLIEQVISEEEAKAARFLAVARLFKAFRRRGTNYRDLLDPSEQKILDGIIFNAFATTGADEARGGISGAEQAAFELLGYLPAEHGQKCLERLAVYLSPDRLPAWRDAAIRALGNRREERVAEILLEHHLALAPQQQEAAIDVLLTRLPWTRKLIEHIDEEETSPTLLTLAQRDRLLLHRDEAVRKQAARLFADQIDSNRQALIARYLNQRPAEVDVARGKQLFAKHCATCHRVEETGHAVGPDLTALKDRSARAIFTAVLDPNRAIEGKFRSYGLLTNDGRMLTGLLSASTGSSVTLLASGGEKQVILRSEIDELRATGKSLMPEGLETQITADELADLAAYLGSLGR